MTDEPGALKTTYLLEMTEREAYRPPAPSSEAVEIRRVEEPCPELNWFLHELVGHPHRWGGREGWGRLDWEAYVSRPVLETWVAYRRGAPIGYFELERRPDRSVRIQCFGLAPRYVGRGFGRWLLGAAVERSWELTDVRVWLGTCSHDHPHALRNYLARGFRVVETGEEPANRVRPSRLFDAPDSSDG